MPVAQKSPYAGERTFRLDDQFTEVTLLPPKKPAIPQNLTLNGFGKLAPRSKRAAPYNRSQKKLPRVPKAPPARENHPTDSQINVAGLGDATSVSESMANSIITSHTINSYPSSPPGGCPRSAITSTIRHPMVGQGVTISDTDMKSNTPNMGLPSIALSGTLTRGGSILFGQQTPNPGSPGLSETTRPLHHPPPPQSDQGMNGMNNQLGDLIEGSLSSDADTLNNHRALSAQQTLDSGGPGIYGSLRSARSDMTVCCPHCGHAVHMGTHQPIPAPVQGLFDSDGSYLTGALDSSDNLQALLDIIVYGPQQSTNRHVSKPVLWPLSILTTSSVGQVSSPTSPPDSSATTGDFSAIPAGSVSNGFDSLSFGYLGLGSFY